MNHLTFLLYVCFYSITMNGFVQTVEANNLTVRDANSTTSSEDMELLCVEPGYKRICSERGVCVNGTCHCWKINDEIDPFFKYSGKYCEECPYCKGRRCEKFMPCVQCVLSDKAQNCSQICSVNYYVVGLLQIEDKNDKLCEREDENGCVFLFKYTYKDRNALELSIEKGKICIDGKKCNSCSQ